MESSIVPDIYEMLCRKHSNCKIYVIADHHFYHSNILQYTRKNFRDIEEMNQNIIKSHNEVVREEDIVLLLGDFCFRNSALKEVIEHLNGYKYLILGNHDNEDLVKNYLSLGIEKVFTTPVKIHDDYFSHEPLIKGEKNDLHFQLATKEFLKNKKGKNYHGHIHSKEEIESVQYKNVTCEALDYQPLFIGKTLAIPAQDKLPLFINSPHLENLLKILKEKHAMDSRIILNDFIYSMILESCHPFSNDFFVQGSFGLLKKYHFLSRFSDLDLSCFYNPNISKERNIIKLKNLSDGAYETLKTLENINLCFIKRYSSMRIFETLYTSKQCFAKGYFDANLLFLDCYKDTDFIILEEKSIMENYLIKKYSPYLEEYHFPKFQALFLTPEGDLASLILQYLFEQGHLEKKSLLLKKIQYVFQRNFKEKEMEEFSDIWIRFFLRNISFLATLHRYNEIEYIQDSIKNILNLSVLPLELQSQMHSILDDKNSLFLDIYKNIASIPTTMVNQKCEDLIRKLK